MLTVAILLTVSAALMLLGTFYAFGIAAEEADRAMKRGAAPRTRFDSYAHTALFVTSTAAGFAALAWSSLP